MDFLCTMDTPWYWLIKHISFQFIFWNARKEKEWITEEQKQKLRKVYHAKSGLIMPPITQSKDFSYMFIYFIM